MNYRSLFSALCLFLMNPSINHASDATSQKDKLLPMTQLFDRANNFDFNLKYGTEALRLKKYLYANLAFERALSEKPKNLKAMLGLGVSYIQLKQYEQARDIFRSILNLYKGDPTITKEAKFYLNAVKQAEKKSKTKLDGYIGLDTGYDSNVAAGMPPDISFIPIPPGPPRPPILIMNLINFPTGFNTLHGGVRLSHEFNKQTHNFLQLYGYHQQSYRASTYDFSFIALNNLFNFEKNNWILTIPAEYRRVFFNHQNLRHEGFAGAELTRKIQNHYVGIYLDKRFFRYDYSKTFNGDSTSYHLNWAWIVNKIPVTFKMDINLAFGKNDDPRSPNIFANSKGFKFVTSWDGIDNVKPTVYLYYQYYHFRDNAPFDSAGAAIREDKFTNLVFLLPIEANKHLLVTPGFSYFWNKSTSDSFRYERWIAQLSLKYSI